MAVRDDILLTGEQDIKDRLTRVEEALKHIVDKLDKLMDALQTGQMPNCVRHQDRMKNMEERLSTIEADQRWLRRQWIIVWMGIGASCAVAGLTWLVTHLGVHL